MYLADREYPTIADFALGCQAMDLMLLGQGYINVEVGIGYNQYPNINKWLKLLLTDTDGFKELHHDYFNALSRKLSVYPCHMHGVASAERLKLEPLMAKMEND